MNFSDLDCRHMARALELAQRGMYTTDPNPRVGCVIARGEQVLGEGWHAYAGQNHAEVAALVDADGGEVAGATAYVTLEPCAHHGKTPPCAARLVDARIADVVVATGDPDARVNGAGVALLREAGVTVREGLMEDEARELNRGFFKRNARGLPYVRVKLAMSIDGRTALASGASQWITGEEARRDVHHWRARSSAIITGIGTVLADDPRMTARVDVPVTPPLLVILDSRARTPPSARLFDRSGDVVIVCSTSANVPQELAQRADVWRLDAPDRLSALLPKLAERGVNELHVEAGATLAGAFVSAKLVDELLLYAAPCALGDNARPLLVLPELERMEERLTFQWQDVARIGCDVRLRLTPVDAKT